MIDPDVFDLRAEDYSLSDEQRDLARSFNQLLSRECTPERVRAAEGSGFDGDLWGRLCAQGAVAMAVADADRATLVDLALVAEEMGTAMAPVPYVDTVVAIRLLAKVVDGLSDEHASEVAGIIEATSEGDEVTVFTPAAGPVGSVAAATRTVRLVDGALVVEHRDPTAGVLENVAALPLAPLAGASSSLTLATGDTARVLHAHALAEWRVLTAAALVGLIRSAQSIAVEFAKTRRTRGVSIGTLQGVAFPLADTEIARETSQHLTRRAAWYLDNEPDAHAELPPAALLHTLRSVRTSAETGVHTLAGLGVSLESDMTLVFRRAQAWALVGERPGTLIDHIGALVAQPAAS